MRTVDPKAHARQVERILDAACSLFARRGFRETTLDDVAAACRMKKPSLYHYFTSKETILRQIILQRVKEAHAGLQTLPREGSLRSRLYQAGLGFLENLKQRRNRDFLSLLVRQVPNDPFVRQIFSRLKRESIAVQGSCQHSPFLASPLDDPELELMAMHQFMSIVVSFACEKKIWRMGPEKGFNDERYIGLLADIFSRGAESLWPPHPQPRTK
jgi:AcrR family transcriptional regulator